MQAIAWKKLSVPMVFHLLWGSVLWFSISKLGLGLSTDSVHLLFAGMNLASGRGLISFDGSPVLVWPPLYPLLLAALHLLTGLSTFAAAHVLQIVAFFGISLCLSIFSLHLFPDDFPFVLAGSILSDIGIVVVASFGMVGSDYVHLFLVVLCVLLTALYVEQPSGRLYLAVFVAAMLAMLQRYLGLAAIATAATAMLVWAKGSPSQHLLRAAFLALAAVPSTLWLLLTSPHIARRAPVSLGENFTWFSQSILEWLFPAASIQAHPVFSLALLWIAIALLALVLWLGRRTLRSFAASMLLFGLLYTLALFGSASIAYYNRLEGRFLLPLYIPLIMASLLALHILLGALHARSPSRYPVGRLAAFGMLAVLAILLLGAAVPAVQASHSGIDGPGENSFNTLAWHANRPLFFWQAHHPEGDYLLLSNQPDGVAFYTQHFCDASPRRRSGPYGTVEYPIESYASTLFASGQDVYLIWVEPNSQDFYYQPADLGSIANLEKLYSSLDGAIYRLTPAPGT